MERSRRRVSELQFIRQVADGLKAFMLEARNNSVPTIGITYCRNNGSGEKRRQVCCWCGWRNDCGIREKSARHSASLVEKCSDLRSRFVPTAITQHPFTIKVSPPTCRERTEHCCPLTFTEWHRFRRTGFRQRSDRRSTGTGTSSSRR